MLRAVFEDSKDLSSSNNLYQRSENHPDGQLIGFEGLSGDFTRVGGFARVLLHLLMSHADQATWQDYARGVVSNTDFQASLLVVAAELVAFIRGQPPFPALTAQLGLLNKSLDIWEAIGCFW